jgi:hypothetical protein
MSGRSSGTRTVEEVIDELRARLRGRSIDAANGALRHRAVAGTSVPTTAAIDDTGQPPDSPDDRSPRCRFEGESSSQRPSPERRAG